MKPLVTAIPSRAPAKEDRKTLPPRWLAQLCIDQKGKCGCGCGKKLHPLTEGFVDEHMVPLAAGGTNDISNRRLLRPECAKAKTKKDAGVIAKTRGMAGEYGSQLAKRAKAKAEGRPRLQSRNTLSKEYREAAKAWREKNV